MDLTENQNLNKIDLPHPWEKSRYIFIKNILKPYLKNRSSYILDFGSGDAFVISQIKKENDKFNFIAIDKYYNPIQINKIKQVLETKNVHNNIESIDIGKNKIEVVLILDVLEHVKRPVTTLNQLKKIRFLSKNCTFIITVPSFQFLFTKHDKVLGHHRRYNLALLEKTVTSAGFNINEKGYFFHSILIIRLFEKLAEMIFSYDNSKKVSKKSSNDFLRKLLTKLLVIDNIIFYKIKKHTGINIPGLSTYIVCQNQR